MAATSYRPLRLPERSDAMYIGALIGVLLLGFIAGLFAFKVKSRWCSECGAQTISLEERRRQIEHTAR